MHSDEKRTYKNRLYELFAFLGKTLAAPRRNILALGHSYTKVSNI